MAKTNGSLPTTVIGSMKKPSYLNIPCWAEKDVFGWGKENPEHATQNGDMKQKQQKEILEKEMLEKQVMQATGEVMDFQSQVGIDIITDGEMRRNNYIYPFCRTLYGFDFEKQKEKTCRNGKWTGNLPCVVSEVSLKPESERSDLAKEWQIAQDISDVPVKYTIPGPLTIADSVANCFYDNEDDFTAKLASMINHTILSLVKRGCKYIQVDEPVLARYPKKAAAAIPNVEACFKDVPNDVTKIVHICCGYPMHLDQKDYEKAEQNAYLEIADCLNNSIIDQVSLEDAHRRNQKELFHKLHKKTIILGVVDVSSSRVESVDEIRQHIKDVLEYVPRDKLVIAPDCGLVLLPDDVMKTKLKNMVAAAKNI